MTAQTQTDTTKVKADSLILHDTVITGDTIEKADSALSADSVAHPASIGAKPIAQSDSTKEQPGKSRIYFGFQLGVQFQDFRQKALFSDDLQEFIDRRYARDTIPTATDSNLISRANKSRTLQPYDQVAVVFPFGLLMGIPLNSFFDVLLTTQSFWKKQKAIIEYTEPDLIVGNAGDTIRGTIYNLSRFYVIQGNLAGCGLKLNFPLDLISIEENKHLFISYTHFWNIGGSEIYTNQGSRSAGRPGSGIGYEVALGFRVSTWKNIAILGNLVISQFKFPSSGQWNSVLIQDIYENMEWEISALKFNFHFIYQLGGFPKESVEDSNQKKPDKKTRKWGF